MIENLFFQIGLLIIIATLGGMLAKALRQPLIPAYIIAGIFLGPILHIVTNSRLIELMSMWGIAFLLFIVGLELDIKKLRSIGKIATLGGTVQVLLTFALTFLLLIALQFNQTMAVYLSIAVALSSTMVVIKLLSDHREITSLHGKIAVGILLMQDLLALIALSVLSAFGSENGHSLVTIFFFVGLFLAAAFLLSKYVFPKLFKFAAQSIELLFLLSVSVCLLFAACFEMVGLSLALGAFLAGISLSGLPYTLEIIGRIKPLRDFFATVFFTSLGLSLTFVSVKTMILPFFALLFATLLMKPLILMVITSFFGYVRRTSFLVGALLGQVSEFSLILISTGLSLGHLSSESYSLVILVSMTTIVTTAYGMHFEKALYKYFQPFLSVLDLASSSKPLQYLPETNMQYDTVLIGYDRIGYNIFTSLQKRKESFLVVDFNPDTIRNLINKQVPCLYGDISDSEIIERLPLQKIKLLISTITSFQDTRYLIHRVKKENEKCRIFVTAATVEDAITLYKDGAEYVILPHFLGGEYASILLEGSQNAQNFARRKYDHIQELHKQMRLGHHYPEYGSWE